MEDFGFVQRDAKVLENAGREGSEENEEEEGEEEEEGRGSLERKSGGSNSPEVAFEAGERGKQQGSDSGSSGGSKGKASRLARTMSAYTSKEKPSQHADPSLSTLPQSFIVKYLGKRDARGLWGIKHTRRPVDHMVTDAKGSDGRPPLVLPLVRLTVSRDGVTLTAAHLTGEKKRKGPEQAVFHPIDTISYGVQDLVYTRVFSMIIVRETTHMLANGQVSQHPFQCHAFVCDSKNSARRLTYVLAAAFQEFSQLLKEQEAKTDGTDAVKKKRAIKKFAIDLRTPEQIEQDLKEPDSEA